jgi:hypothetical protein
VTGGWILPAEKAKSRKLNGQLIIIVLAVKIRSPAEFNKIPLHGKDFQEENLQPWSYIMV